MKLDFERAPVLVTGGAGFIGSHLVDELLARGARVRVLDDLSTGLESNLEHCGGEIEFMRGDLRDVDACREACLGRTVVFHQAALGSVPRSMEDPATTFDVNVAGTANLFAAARDAGTRRLVYASSSAVYGDSAALPKREGEEGRPLSPYALSKRMNEELAELFGACYDLEIVGLRYFNVYGPRQRPDGPYAAVIPRFFQAALESRAAEIHGDGEQTRDFTFVADAVQANLLAARATLSAPHAAVNVAGGRRISVNELARSVGRVTGESRPPRHLPPRAGDVRHSLADLANAEELLDYHPATGLDEGLAASLTHYRALSAR